MTDTNRPETVHDVLRDMRQWKGDYSVFADRIERALSARASAGEGGEAVAWRKAYQNGQRGEWRLMPVPSVVLEDANLRNWHGIEYAKFAATPQPATGDAATWEAIDEGGERHYFLREPVGWPNRKPVETPQSAQAQKDESPTITSGGIVEVNPAKAVRYAYQQGNVKKTAPQQAGASGGGDGWWEGLGNEVIDGEACILYQHTTTGAQLWCRKSEHEKVDALLKGLTTSASPATGDWFADALTATGEAVPLDAELPGMWERADLIGGATDVAPQPQDERPASMYGLVNATPPAHGDGEGDYAAKWFAECRRVLEDVSTEMRATGRGDTRFRRLIESMPRQRTTRPTPEAQEARDAARYRWLRDPENAIVYAKDLANWNGVPYSKPYGHFSYATPEQLDTAIDAALALPAQGEGENG